MMRTLVLFILLGAVMVCWTVACYAVHEIGSPLPYARPGGFAGGIGYHYYKAQWEYDGGECDGDELPGNVLQNYVYAQGSYGLIPGWEAYVRVGAVDAVLEEALSPDDGFDEAVDFEGGFKLYFGGGLRGLIYGTQTFQVGPFFQYNRYSTYDDELDGSIGGTPVTVPTEFSDAYDVNVGLGVNYPVGPAGMLYGGFFGYWAKAAGTFEVPQNPQENDLKEQSNLGGFLGLRLPLGSGLQLNFEGVYKTDMSASVSINKAFGM